MADPPEYGPRAGAGEECGGVAGRGACVENTLSFAMAIASPTLEAAGATAPGQVPENKRVPNTFHSNHIAAAQLNHLGLNNLRVFPVSARLPVLMQFSAPLRGGYPSGIAQNVAKT